MLTSYGRDDGFVEHVHDLIKKKDYETAYGMLRDYTERYPKIAMPYRLFVKVCMEMGDNGGLFWAAEQLLQVGERSYEDYTLYRVACVLNEMPATLIGCDEQMERRFSFKSEADLVSVRKDMAADFREDSALIGIDTAPYTDEQLIDLIQRHEKTLVYLGSGRFDLAIRHCDKLITRYPFFRSSYNNKALAVLHNQGPAAAEPFLRQALEHHPDNLYAHAFKMRQLALLGRYEELPDYCNRLAAISKILPDQPDFYPTKIEAFAWADDLDRVIETYQFARQQEGEKWDTARWTFAKATHCAAVAHARLGNRETALELWKSIPDDTFDTATENLKDIQQPAGEQNGPWFFEEEQWLPKQLSDMFCQAHAQANIDEDLKGAELAELVVQTVKPVFKRAFAVFPSLERTMIGMLQRGGPDSRQWVYMATGHCPTPELQSAIVDFISGQSGTDECRSAFLSLASQLKWLLPDTLQLWRKGEECTLRMASVEVYWEARETQPPLSPAGARKVAQSHDAVRENDYERAIELLTEVNAAEPGRASVRYNIAVYHMMLGHEGIYNELLDQVIEDFPDYLFSKTSQAKRLIQQNRLDETLEILKPLYEMTQLHATEFKAFSVAQIMYHLARGEMEVAQAIHQNGKNIMGETFPSFEAIQQELTRNKPLPL